jgi:hypothetical protein
VDICFSHQRAAVPVGPLWWPIFGAVRVLVLAAIPTERLRRPWPAANLHLLCLSFLNSLRHRFDLIGILSEVNGLTPGALPLTRPALSIPLFTHLHIH